MPASAWAYRPFVFTDAAVADPREVEIELGYFNLERTHSENTIATPSVVLNYGVTKNLELVGELSPNKDALGIPRPLFTFDVGDCSRAALREGFETAKELFNLMGATVVGDQTMPEGKWNTAAHIMGTCIMGDEPTSSVVNRWGRAHDLDRRVERVPDERNCEPDVDACRVVSSHGGGDQPGDVGR